MPTESRDLRRYLLGELPEADRTTLEERYFQDEELFESVREAEHALVDDYVAGRLGAGDHASFERHYLSTPGHVERVAVARALAAAEGTADVRAPGRPTAWRWALAAALLLGTLGVWFSLSTREPVAPDQVAVPEQTGPSLPKTPVLPRADDGGVPTLGPPPLRRDEHPPVVVAMVLTPSAGTRGDGPTPTAIVPATADEVELQLAGASEGARGLTVELRSVDAGVVWVGRAGAPRAPRPAGASASVVVPARHLSPGDYVLRTSAADGEVVGTYSFRTERP